MNHLTPEGIQAWLNTLTALITAGGTVGLLLITTIFMLIKAIKDKQKEMEVTATATTEKVDKNAQHTAENYGTLTQVAARVDSHGAALGQIALATPQQTAPKPPENWTTEQANPFADKPGGNNNA